MNPSIKYQIRNGERVTLLQFVINTYSKLFDLVYKIPVKISKTENIVWPLTLFLNIDKISQSSAQWLAFDLANLIHSLIKRNWVKGEINIICKLWYKHYIEGTQKIFPRSATMLGWLSNPHLGGRPLCPKKYFQKVSKKFNRKLQLHRKFKKVPVINFWILWLIYQIQWFCFLYLIYKSFQLFKISTNIFSFEWGSPTCGPTDHCAYSLF